MSSRGLLRSNGAGSLICWLGRVMRKKLLRKPFTLVAPVSRALSW